MAYTRTTWQNSNTPLSAANMNNIEDGIEESLAASAAVTAKLYPVGSIHITDENVNPGTALGGTWELISKKFAYQTGTSGVAFNSTNTEDGAVTWIRKESSIMMRLNWKNKVRYGEEEVVIATFNISDLGLTGTPYSMYVPGISDGLDSIPMLGVSYSGGIGTIKMLDMVYKSVQPTTTGATLHVLFNIMFGSNHMLNSACNQFVWRRTA